jgi:hypothetical protein
VKGNIVNPHQITYAIQMGSDHNAACNTLEAMLAEKGIKHDSLIQIVISTRFIRVGRENYSHGSVNLSAGKSVGILDIDFALHPTCVLTRLVCHGLEELLGIEPVWMVVGTGELMPLTSDELYAMHQNVAQLRAQNAIPYLKPETPEVDSATNEGNWLNWKVVIPWAMVLGLLLLGLLPVAIVLVGLILYWYARNRSWIRKIILFLTLVLSVASFYL